MVTHFYLSVEDELTWIEAKRILSDLEEALAKLNLSLEDSDITGDEWEESIGSDPSCGE